MCGKQLLDSYQNRDFALFDSVYFLITSYFNKFYDILDLKAKSEIET